MTDTERWLECFPSLAPDKVLEQFLPLLGAAWEEKKGRFTATSWEDAITRTLYSWIKKSTRDSTAYAWGLRCQPEVIGEGIDGIGRVIGRCDLVITVANMEYIYECKRLWPEGKKENFTESARRYVHEGVHRFLQPSEKQIGFGPQYPAWCEFAGMLGYVMNGNMPNAIDSVHTAISQHAPAQTVESPCEPPCPAEEAHHFLSVHCDCSGKQLSLHHVLLVLPAHPL